MFLLISTRRRPFGRPEGSFLPLRPLPSHHHSHTPALPRWSSPFALTYDRALSYTRHFPAQPMLTAVCTNAGQITKAHWTTQSLWRHFLYFKSSLFLRWSSSFWQWKTPVIPSLLTHFRDLFFRVTSKAFSNGNLLPRMHRRYQLGSWSTIKFRFTFPLISDSCHFGVPSSFGTRSETYLVQWLQTPSL